MHVEVRAELEQATLEELKKLVPRFGNLQDVVRWAFSLQPPRDVAAVVVQDEYSHDVVIPWRAPLHLVFDTT